MEKAQAGGGYSRDTDGNIKRTREPTKPRSAATVEVPVEAEAPPEETEAETTDDEE